MTIYFVRHGKDEDGYRGGWSQRSLIQEGKEQAERLANHLYENKDTFNFTRIVSSDLNRAKETASYIGRKFGMEVELNQEWRETNNGVIAGLPNEEVEKTFPGLYFGALEMDERYPGGESPKDFFSRIKESFYNLRDEVQERNEDVLIVTHGGVINIIYYLIEDIKWTNRSKSFKCLNTSLHKVELDGEKMKVTLSNYIEHLKS